MTFKNFQALLETYNFSDRWSTTDDLIFRFLLALFCVAFLVCMYVAIYN
jgi:hypothetical protein